MSEFPDFKQGAHAAWEGAGIPAPSWYLAPGALLDAAWLDRLSAEEFRVYHYLAWRGAHNGLKDFDHRAAAKELHTTPAKLVEMMFRLANAHAIQMDVRHECQRVFVEWPIPPVCPGCDGATDGCCAVRFRTVHQPVSTFRLESGDVSTKPKAKRAKAERKAPEYDRAALNAKIQHYARMSGIPDAFMKEEFWKQWGAAVRNIGKRLVGTPYTMAQVESVLSDYYHMGFPYDQPHVFVNHIVEALCGQLKPFRRGAVRPRLDPVDRVSSEGNTSASDLLKQKRANDTANAESGPACGLDRYL